MAELVVLTIIGLFLIYHGYRVGWKGDMTGIHRYHYANLPEENKAAFCKECGIGEGIMGIGCTLMPYINWVSQTEIGYWTGLFANILGFSKIVLTIIKYNGKLF